MNPSLQPQELQTAPKAFADWVLKHHNNPAAKSDVRESLSQPASLDEIVVTGRKFSDQYQLNREEADPFSASFKGLSFKQIGAALGDKERPPFGAISPDRGLYQPSHRTDSATQTFGEIDLTGDKRPRNELLNGIRPNQ